VIDIKIEISNDKIIKDLIIKGHSNYDEYGKDIVCAAVSILVYTAYLSLKLIPDVKTEYVDDKSSVILSLKNVLKNIEGEVRGISIFLVSGLKLLSEKYQENVNFNLIVN
jgi:uncharacterized protein